MLRINNGRLVKRDVILLVAAWFDTTSDLPDVFISKSEKVVIYVFHNSEKKASVNYRIYVCMLRFLQFHWFLYLTREKGGGDNDN